jgi:hypothetical protein
MKGTVDLAKLPTVKAGAQTATQAATQAAPQRFDPLTPEQRAAYEASLKHATNLPRADAGAPFVIPDPAVATDLSYVMEGVSYVLAIYRTSDGSLAFGPYLESSFFAPLLHGSDQFSNTRMDYDVMRDRWIVVALDGSSNGPTYLDIAVSASNSSSQPTPGGQYHEYQILTTFHGSQTRCACAQLGVEYYSLTITCGVYDFSGLLGNETIVIDNAPLLTGAPASYTLYQDVMLDNGHFAYSSSPAIEDGVQDAEYLMASEEGWGGPFSKITLCTLTNTRNIATIAPTYTCDVVDLGASYSDPVGARQPGITTNLTVGLGTGQLYFKAGRLYFALSTAITGPRDGVLWAEMQPQLTAQAAHNPQWINGVDYVDTGMFYFSDPNTDVYMPTVMGTDENDISLVFNYGGNTTSGLYPSVGFTGRKVSDAPGTMGQGGTSGTAIAGAGALSTLSEYWSSYSGCAIPLISVTRGTVWCGHEYMASANVWKTRLIALRLK